MWRATIVLLMVSAVSGCRPSYPSHMTIGPYGSIPSARLWERTLAAVREAHYRPEQVDPNLGRIIIPSRVYGSRERILIQLYREGWIQLGPATSAPAGWKVYVPPEVSEEQLALTLMLRQQLERASTEHEPSAGGKRPPS